MIENLKYIDLDGNEKEEEWRSISGYEGLYEVSNMGRIKAKEKTFYMGWNKLTKKHRPEKIVTPKGYRYYNAVLYNNGKAKTFLIHRLVALSFLPIVDGLPIVNHKDANKKNNLHLNLEWSNSQLNTKHAFDMGLMGSGENCAASKLNWESVNDIRNSHGSVTIISLAKKYSVTRVCITDIIKMKTWKHIS